MSIFNFDHFRSLDNGYYKPSKNRDNMKTNEFLMNYQEMYHVLERFEEEKDGKEIATPWSHVASFKFENEALKYGREMQDNYSSRNITISIAYRNTKQVL